MVALELVAPTHRIDGTAGVVCRASELAEATAAGGVDRLLPVAGKLAALLPAGGLRRGSTVALAPGPGSPPGPPGRSPAPASSPGAGPASASGSLLLALLAGVSASGAWSVVVGMPGLGGLAAAQAGVALERLALIPYPGPEWTSVVAALLDGVDLVVVAPPAPVAPRVASRLAARARQRGGVLVPYGRWEGAELTLVAEPGAWEGLGAGRGRLRCRELTITARGRGAAARPRVIRVRLPDPTGRLAAAPPRAAASERPVFTVIAGGSAAPAETAVAGRPAVAGEAA